MQQNATCDLEKKQENLIKTFLIAKNWWVRKLHGNLYQAGLPDLLLCRPKDGLIILAEIKTLVLKKEMFGIDIVELLEGPQTGTILLLAKKKAPVCIIVGTQKGFLFVKAPFKPTERVYPSNMHELYDDLNSM